jgi:hypothetical protein
MLVVTRREDGEGREDRGDSGEGKMSLRAELAWSKAGKSI